MNLQQTLTSQYWQNVLNWARNAPKIDFVTQYAINALQNDFVASVAVKMACCRHLLFLYRSNFEPDFPFFFKTDTLDRLIAFSNSIIIPETRKPFVFTDFRKFIAGFVFGWVYKDEPDKLITNEVFDVEARKQWKSSFWAMIALATTRGLLGIGKQEIYFCGPHKASSKIPYDIALNYIKASKKLQKKFSVYNSLRIVSKKEGIIKALPFDKAGLEGQNPSLVILTEYHLHKDDTMQESAKSSNNLSRKNQLIVYDTTKGNNINSVCYHREKDYKNFLAEQIMTPESLHPNFNIFIFCAELDEDDYDNWQDTKLWAKANPGLNVTVSLEALVSEFNAITNAQAEAEFKAKRLGMWTSAAYAYFSIDQITESLEHCQPIVENFLKNNSLKNLNALVGLDLSSNIDTTALVIHWEIPIENNKSIYVFAGHGFIPETSIIKKEVSDKARYRNWVNKGYFTITPGKVIDYEHIVKKLSEWNKDFKIDKILHDSWQKHSIKQYITGSNLFNNVDIVEVKQGVYLTPFFRLFEQKLMNKEIYFMDFNEMLISQMLNVNVKSTTSGSETLFIKKLSTNSRIDSFIACLNALSERHNTLANKPELIYDIV